MYARMETLNGSDGEVTSRATHRKCKEESNRAHAQQMKSLEFSRSHSTDGKKYLLGP